ncbi:MAG: class I SAM-dependent methyltransferase [Chloroflexi bacterium]|nr:class I SAM-dependent methyltransferase [Chloroflexota bacterium]
MNDGREYFYESIASQLDSLINPYDLQRRLEVLFDELLPEDLSGIRMLDLGCGTGWFSQRARQRGADVVSLDISRSLVLITRLRSQSMGLVADAGLTPFATESFELVVSSEMLEHLRDPSRGIGEIGRILAPGGIAAITTPNRRWLWLVRLATSLGIRPYRGYENFLGYDELHRLLKLAGLEIELQQGFHPWPFQFAFLHAISHRVDRRCGRGLTGKRMANQALRARKRVFQTASLAGNPTRDRQGFEELA